MIKNTKSSKIEINRFNDFLEYIRINSFSLFGVYSYLQKKDAIKWVNKKYKDKVINDKEYLRELLMVKNGKDFSIFRYDGRIVNLRGNYKCI